MSKSIQMPTHDEMRTRFWELKAQRDKIDAKRAPVREARDELVTKHAKELEAADAKVRKAEEGLFEVDQEMAMLVRACGGRMGDPEAQ